MPSELVERIIDLARAVQNNPDYRYKLSTGELIAAALLLGRIDYLPEGYTHPLDAVKRLGDNWLNAVLIAHEIGWE